MEMRIKSILIPPLIIIFIVSTRALPLDDKTPSVIPVTINDTIMNLTRTLDTPPTISPTTTPLQISNNIEVDNPLIPAQCPRDVDGDCVKDCESDKDCSRSRDKCCTHKCGKICTPGVTINPGHCPVSTKTPSRPPCTDDCKVDAECGWNEKCCANRCGGRSCSRPIFAGDMQPLS